MMICGRSGIKVRIYIPTENCIDKIDITMNSIINLDYPRENVEVMIIDFDSSDGTYERLLDYQDRNIGIYRINKKVDIKNQYKSYEKIVANHGYDQNCMHMGMKPGDIIYPDSMDYINRALSYLDNSFIKGIICEVDRELNPSLNNSQPPLFKKPFIISEKECNEYIVRGFNHKVLSLNREAFTSHGDYNKIFYNDWNNWNYKFIHYYQSQCLYLPKPVALIHEEVWKNEFEICLMYHACLMGNFRTYENRKYATRKEIQNMAFINSAYHSIWRSFCAFLINNKKEAKQCLLHSKILYPDIERDKAFLYMKELLEKNTEASFEIMLEKMPLEVTKEVPETAIPLDII